MAGRMSLQEYENQVDALAAISTELLMWMDARVVHSIGLMMTLMIGNMARIVTSCKKVKNLLRNGE